jgi:hypothetical protein
MESQAASAMLPGGKIKGPLVDPAKLDAAGPVLRRPAHARSRSRARARDHGRS